MRSMITQLGPLAAGRECEAAKANNSTRWRLKKAQRNRRRGNAALKDTDKQRDGERQRREIKKLGSSVQVIAVVLLRMGFRVHRRLHGSFKFSPPATKTSCGCRVGVQLLRGAVEG